MVEIEFSDNMPIAYSINVFESVQLFECCLWFSLHIKRGTYDVDEDISWIW